MTVIKQMYNVRLTGQFWLAIKMVKSLSHSSIVNDKNMIKI